MVTSHQLTISKTTANQHAGHAFVGGGFETLPLYQTYIYYYVEGIFGVSRGSRATHYHSREWNNSYSTARYTVRYRTARVRRRKRSTTTELIVLALGPRACFIVPPHNLSPLYAELRADAIAPTHASLRARIPDCITKVCAVLLTLSFHGRAEDYYQWFPQILTLLLR